MARLTLINGLLRVSGDGGLVTSSEPCCCETPCYCRQPTEWRIITADAQLYAKGPIIFVPEVGLVLEDLPNPVPPLFYWTVEPQMWRLEIQDCGDGWVMLEEWEVDIALCEGARYTNWTLAGVTVGPGTGIWYLPDGCNFEVEVATDEPCDPESPIPCLGDLIPGSGTGQSFRDPVPGPARIFTGAIDGEWTNLLNWQDAGENSPASTLPDENSDVFIYGDVTSSAVAIFVKSMYIDASGNLRVSATIAEDLECLGVIWANGPCECEEVISEEEVCESPQPCVYITAGGEAIFDGSGGQGQNQGAVITAPTISFNGGYNVGTLITDNTVIFAGGAYNEGIVNSDAEFSGSYNVPGGNINGNAKFSDVSENSGHVKENAEFYSGSYNYGTIGFTIVGSFSGDLLDYQPCNPLGGLGAGFAEFYDDTVNQEGAIVYGGAVFNNQSENYGYVYCGVIFNDESENYGTLDVACPPF